MKRADARVEAVTEHEPNDERPKDDDVILVDEIPHCGHILQDEEGREVATGRVSVCGRSSDDPGVARRAPADGGHPEGPFGSMSVAQISAAALGTLLGGSELVNLWEATQRSRAALLLPLGTAPIRAG